MKEELLKLKKLLLEQAEQSQLKMFSADNKDSWIYGYNQGVRTSAIMMVNSINEILEKHEQI